MEPAWSSYPPSTTGWRSITHSGTARRWSTATAAAGSSGRPHPLPRCHRPRAHPRRHRIRRGTRLQQAARRPERTLFGRGRFARQAVQSKSRPRRGRLAYRRGDPCPALGKALRSMSAPARRTQATRSPRTWTTTWICPMTTTPERQRRRAHQLGNPEPRVLSGGHGDWGSRMGRRRQDLVHGPDHAPGTQHTIRSRLRATVDVAGSLFGAAEVEAVEMRGRRSGFCRETDNPQGRGHRRHCCANRTRHGRPAAA